ncbi:hypothetical protein PR048_008120 [Dryococelus australis]|uniref:RUN domain-containing protein n=1 Tax=Dryococelus australis TaxID=614101 RepID=A0ABQ9HW75_9NEOP|nr:hypothetical protein PR048_008120 [Dryococelus australis]
MLIAIYLEDTVGTLNLKLCDVLCLHLCYVMLGLPQCVVCQSSNKELLLRAHGEFAVNCSPSSDPSSLLATEMQCSLLVLQDYIFVLTPNVSHILNFPRALNQVRVRQTEGGCLLMQTGEAREMYMGECIDYKLQCVQRISHPVIIHQLKGKLNINVDDIDILTADELRSQVDYAVSQLVNPLKVKEHLVMQLKTQISDLERFIHFLQGETSFETEKKKCTCSCHQHSGTGLKPTLTRDSREEIRKETVNIMRKASALLQMFAAAQFGCGADHFQKNLLKRTGRGRHWGDLRARLEVTVNYVLELMSRTERSMHTDYSSDSEDVPAIVCDAKLAHAVRKQLALSIRDLMQHGLMPIGQSESIVPFVGCFAHTQSPVDKTMHVWELILKYYELKNGERFNSTPARTLSQSFKLDIVGGTAISNKQNLLSVIGNILTTHTQYKRSYDSHFKAFVCAALNHKKLVTWLRLILHCQTLLEWYYQSWSYVVKTGFEDSYDSLNRLTHLKFELPVDLAVRQFQNIKDAF